MKKYLKRQWEQFKKQSLLGKIFDVVILVILIGLVFPPTRKPVASLLIRTTLMAPGKDDHSIKLTNEDYQFGIYDLNGVEHSFAEFKGKPVFFNQWATWCPPCVAELPTIQKLYDDYGDKVAFVIATHESPAKVKQFISDNGYTFPVYIVPGQVPGVFQTRSIPASYIISPDDKLVLRKKGAADWNSSRVRKMFDDMIQ